MESEKLISNERIRYGAMFFFTGLCVLVFSIVTGRNYEIILRNTITAFIFAGTVIFMVKDALGRGEKGFSYDNFYKQHRFFAAYMGMVVLSCFISLVPSEFWPFMSLFVILSLFSNKEIGLISGTGFIMIAVMLEQNGGYGEFFMYVLAGCVAVVLLSDLGESTNIGYPLFISLLMQAVLLLAFNVLFQNRTLSLNILVLPVLNLMLNLIIELAFLNMFGVYIIRKNNDMYMEINDSEYPLFVSICEKDKNERFRAMHTSYLTERICHELGYDERSAKTCVYYHRIGILDGKYKWEDVEHYYTENNFPPRALGLLKEYIEPDAGQMLSGEALAILISETVITSIKDLINRNKNATIDYDKLIDDQFDGRLKDGSLKKYEVTFADYEKMRSILKKEKLYYDFLR